MNYQKIIFFSILVTLPFVVEAQVTTFLDDKVGWTAAAGGVITAQEDFESFPDSTSFQGVTVGANGFTLRDINPRPTTYSSNYIDGAAPFELNAPNSKNATFFVKFNDGVTGNGPISIDVRFTIPVSAFYAEFTSVLGTEYVDVDLYSGAVLVATHFLNMNDIQYGFVTDANQSDITHMEFRANMNPPLSGNGEGFYMDNVCLVQSPSNIPTLSQWAIIILGFLLLIFSVQAVKSKSIPSLG